MIPRMTRRINSLKWAEFVEMTQHKFKKRFKKKIKPAEIKEICDNWIKYRILEELITGSKVQIDKYSTIQIIGVPVLEDKNFMRLLKKGKTRRRDGTLKTATLNPRRKDFKYWIEYTHSLAKRPIYFEADPKFSKAVHEAIVNQNHYYKINYDK